MEDPTTLLGRLKLGREEYCQRLLTMLILDDSYPRWNTRSTPSSAGLRFLALLEQLSFGSSEPWDEPVFIDELDLPKRHDQEQGGAPDLSLQDAQRLWLIELKTEAGSHRTGQIPTYFELGRHHYPKHRLDITYLTGPLNKPAPATPPGSRFSHVTWQQVLPLIHDVWSQGSVGHRAATQALDDVLGDLATPWSQWRTGRLGAISVESAPAVDPTAEALELAGYTAVDRRQRALDHAPASLEDLQALRLDVREAIVDSSDSELRHVQPWLWRWKSGGQPITPAGRESGYELRLSWYETPMSAT